MLKSAIISENKLFIVACQYIMSLGGTLKTIKWFWENGMYVLIVWKYKSFFYTNVFVFLFAYE